MQVEATLKKPSKTGRQTTYLLCTKCSEWICARFMNKHKCVDKNNEASKDRTVDAQG